MNKVLFIGLICSLFIVGCSPNVVGTWNVDRYEVDNQKGQNFTTRNAGELVIEKNGTGQKNIEYNMFQNEMKDVQSFKWRMQGEDLITITSGNPEEESEFDKTWIMITNKKKEQVWKSTDGRNSVQVLRLSKK